MVSATASGLTPDGGTFSGTVGMQDAVVQNLSSVNLAVPADRLILYVDGEPFSMQ